MARINYLYIIILILVVTSCEETTEAYLGFPLQPEIEENNYEAGLNIIGVIRPDFTDTINNSFVHVQEVAPAINNYPEFTPDSLIVKNAEVLISDTNANSFSFTYTNQDSLFETVQYRPNSEFNPTAGELYNITCNYNNLPSLNSETIIPNKPSIIEPTIQLSNNNIYFEISADTTAFLYEVYIYLNDKKVGYGRIISKFTENTQIEIQLSENSFSNIEVYAYDYNLASYYITSNTSLNFNKYRKTFGNVQNGYGVFGSLNFEIYHSE